MEKLHPGAKWVFRLSGLVGGIFVAVFLGWFLGIFGSILFNLAGGSLTAGLGIVLFMVLVFIVIVLVVAEIYARLAYNNWSFEFTKDNLKVERGIIWKKYSNIPYERVQNVDVTRGILARIFGFSSVNVQTAGYSGYGRGGRVVSEGYLPAVSPVRAEEIREFLMKRISKKGI